MFIDIFKFVHFSSFVQIPKIISFSKLYRIYLFQAKLLSIILIVSIQMQSFLAQRFNVPRDKTTTTTEVKNHLQSSFFLYILTFM